MHITNDTGIPLGLAVWALHDEYDYQSIPNYISVTTLLKPLKQIILSKRIPPGTVQEDVSDYVARAIGKSVHDSIEKAWTHGYAKSLKLMGYSQSVIDLVRINPTEEDLATVENIIPVYLEQRELREIAGFVVGGKYDMVAEGVVQDVKSTTAYTWLFGGRDEEHILQGSMYRWLNPKKITEDHMVINYIFTDWQSFMAKTNPNYPQKRLESKRLELLSLEKTEQYITEKLGAYRKYFNAPEEQIPECSEEDLWRSADQYKYYSDPNKTSGRSTRNFDTSQEAAAFLAEKGKGVVITTKGTVKRCGFCPAFSICKQKDKYEHS